MKKLFLKIKSTVVNFFKWVWRECKDWRTIALLALVCIVIGSPVWVGYLLGILFGWEWAIVAATVAWGFWMLPGAPYFALCVSVTLAIKRIYQRWRKKKETPRDPKVDADSTDSNQQP
ncbi:MAG: hypothetical protein IJY39_11285 [Clostridia bacterium]|nr:hypothetical protein [Clostridia bacterium]